MLRILKSRSLQLFAYAVLLCSLTNAQQPAGFSLGSGRNPSLAGASGDGALMLTYVSGYPGSGYGLNSYYLNYDTFIEKAHGGAGIFISSDNTGGLLNDSRLRLAYSYHLRASRDLFVFAGMSAGVIYRSFNTSKLIFPDQIDPLNGPVLPAGEAILSPSVIIYDMGVGFTVLYRNSMLSFDASHLFKPDLSGLGIPGTELSRVFTVQAFTRQGLRKEDIFLVPYAEMSVGGGNYRIAIGPALEYSSVSAGVLWLKTHNNSSIQTSISVRSGRMSWHYAFRFLAGEAEAGLPFGLMHQAGLRAGLNIVDKRKTIKAINLPDL
ncbi:MAG: type IX secretion system membrane protein PorP/SprF [Bacteroidales bacterium]|nr:type IX secretion system membrane protein PorP/SprF [Bacteroidales bacterium]